MPGPPEELVPLVVAPLLPVLPLDDELLFEGSGSGALGVAVTDCSGVPLPELPLLLEEVVFSSSGGIALPQATSAKKVADDKYGTMVVNFMASCICTPHAEPNSRQISAA